MRFVTVGSLALVALAANLASAQDSLSLSPRLVLTITAGRAAASPIFRHSAFIPLSATLAQQRDQELWLDAGSVSGVRISYRVAPKWRVSAEVGDGPAHFTYRDSTAWVDAAGSSPAAIYYWWGDARHTLFGVGIGRELLALSETLALETELGYAEHRLKVGRDFPVCVPTPPTNGYLPCETPESWMRTYRVRSIESAIAIRYHMTRYLGVLLRGEYSAGSTSTRDAFPYPSDAVFAPAPSQWIRTRYFCAGLSVWP